ncbi:MAG: GntR family transcriptional regulator [Dehalobacterium sp.]
MIELEQIMFEQYAPIRDNVFDILRNAILNGNFKPGERLAERELAEQLGISRTPVREAIRKLEQEGLVVHIPRKGVVVKSISNDEVVEIFTIRAALEGVAVRLATKNISKEDILYLRTLQDKMENAFNNGKYNEIKGLHIKFNQIIYTAANSPRLYQMIQNFAEYIGNYTQIGYNFPGRLEQAIREHSAILNAITDKNDVLAEKLAIEHIDNTKYAFLKTVNEP